MSQIQLLYQLQQLDSEIQEKTGRLREVLQAQKETDVLLAARKRMKTAVSTHQSALSAQKTLRGEMDILDSNKKRAGQRLYSGNVKNPKELADLQSKIDSLGRRRTVLEDEMLELMMAVDDAEEEQAAADAQLAQIEADWKDDQADLEKEKRTLALQLYKLGEERKTKTPLIEPPLLKKYDGIIARKGGLAVSRLRGDQCSGCRLNVSQQVMKRVNEGEIVECHSCGRILSPIR